MRTARKSCINDTIARECFLDSVVNKAFKIIRAENIQIQANIDDISWGRAWTSAWGRCYIRRRMFGDMSFEIKLNTAFYTNANAKACLNTLLHELLHTVPGCFNHGKLWKLYANKLNKKYNLRITRCTTEAEQGIMIRKTSRPRTVRVTAC